MTKPSFYSALFIIAAICLIASCQKDHKLYVRGRLFVTDSLLLNVKDFPLARKRVMLAANAKDSLNFIYSDSTDANGYFIFNLQDDGANDFKVRFSDSIGGYKYYGVQSAHKGDDGVSLTAYLDSTNLTGVSIVNADSLNGHFANAVVSFFPGIVQANLDDATGATLNIMADGNGIASTYKLKPGMYYINSKKAVDTMVFQIKAAPLNVTLGKHLTDTVILRRTK